MIVENTISVKLFLDPAKTKRGTVLDIPDGVVEAAKACLRDGQYKVIADRKGTAFYIVEPRNPWVERSALHDKCEDVCVLAVTSFKGYSFPKGSLEAQP